MSFTTATAHLPDGNDICYIDSGPVEGSTYATIVMLHGSGFNSHVFEHLHVLAAQYKLRLIAVQRRDYAGSTSYADAELEDLQKGDPVFLDRWTVLFGHLLQHLIQTHDLHERAEGGVALLGWSMGCASAISLLSNANLLGQEQYDFLRRYITQIMFYDPPCAVFGFDPFLKGYPVLGKTTEEYFANFGRFVSSYFDHPKDWDGNPAELDQRVLLERATCDSWTDEQFDKMFDIGAAMRSEMPAIGGTMQIPLRNLVQRALFDVDTVKATFPDVSVVHILCQKSPGSTLWGCHNIQKQYLAHQANNEFVRPLSFKIIEGGNHFWHWDFPKDFLQTLADSVRGGQSITPSLVRVRSVVH